MAPASALTKVQHTATVDPAVPAMSNEPGGSQGDQLGSTSSGSTGAARVGLRFPGVGLSVGLVAGVVFVWVDGDGIWTLKFPGIRTRTLFLCSART